MGQRVKVRRAKRGTWRWHAPPYAYDIILVRCPLSNAPEILRTAYGAKLVAMLDKAEFFHGNPGGRCFMAEETRRNGTQIGVVIIWLPAYKEGRALITALTHEAAHAAFGILRESGAELTRASEEAYTYYLDQIMHEALTRLGMR